MTVKKTVLLAFAFAWASGTAHAEQSFAGSSLSSDKQNSSTKATAQQRNRNQYTNYYLVNDTESYSGDSLNIGQRQFQLSRDGAESSGRRFSFGGLLLLWNPEANSYDLLDVDAIESGVWKSCWGQDVESVRTCGEGTEVVYIFEDEGTAIDFVSPGTDDGELAMGPEPTQPEPTQPDPEPTQPEPTQPAPEPEPTEPTPEPEPTQPTPEPEPEPTQPTPEPEPTQPAPEPEPTQPVPESEPTQPVPEPEPTQPTPEPEPTQPAPEPEPTEPTPEPEPTQPENIDQVTCAAPTEELKAAILQSTNDLRSQARQCGTESFASAGALTWNNSLAAAARVQSNDMANNNFFSHTGSDGLKVWNRANAQGYEYRYIGENIAAGQRTVGVVQTGWINSPGHCRNIMNPQITEMGAACVVDSESDYGNYWTVVVGEQR